MLEQVALLLQETAQYAREQARRQVESLVTSSLQVVFGPAFRFRIEVAEQRGAAQAEFYVVSDLAGTPLETRPQEARGGGVVDVVALALRLAMLQIYRPRLEGPLVLDEPAKHVSDEYIQAVAQFLAEVSRAFDRQVLMVTHNPHLAATAGTVFQVDLRDGCSAVARVEGEAAPWPN